MGDSQHTIGITIQARAEAEALEKTNFQLERMATNARATSEQAKEMQKVFDHIGSGGGGNGPAGFLDQSWEKSFKAYIAMGEQTGETFERLLTLRERGISAEKAYGDAIQERWEGEQRLAAEEMSRADIEAIMTGRYIEENGVLVKLNETNAVRLRTSVEEAQAVRQNIALYDSLSNSHEKANKSTRGNMEQSFAFFGAAMAAQTGVRMLETALGDKLPPAAKNAANSLGLVSDGAMIGSMILPGLGTAAGAVAGGIAGLGMVVISQDPKIQQLDQSLDQLAKKDETIETLAKVGATSKETAESMMKLAKDSPEAAAGLRDYVKASQDLNVAQKYIDAGGRLFQYLGGMIDFAHQRFDNFVADIPLLGDLGHVLGLGNLDVWRKAEADQAAAKVREAAENKLTTEVEKEEAKQIDAVGNAAIKRVGADLNAQGDRIAAERQFTAQAAKLEKVLQDQIDEMAWKAAERDKKIAYDRSIIERQLTEAIASAEQSLNNRKADLSRDGAEKILDDAWDHEHKHDSLNSDKLARERNVADELRKLWRDTYEKIADDSFNTTLDMQKAQTEHDRAEIDLRATYEKSTTLRRAGDRQQDALLDLDAFKLASEQKRKLLDEEYAHDRDIAKRENKDRLDDAIRTHDQQGAAAKLHNKDAVDDFTNRIETENREIIHQSDLMFKQHEDQEKDLKKKLADEKITIKDRFQMEKDQIESTKNSFINASNARIEQMKKESEAERTFGLGGYGASASADVGFKGGGNLLTTLLHGLGIPGFASGVDMWTNGPMLFAAGEGGKSEHVVVTPEGESGRKGTGGNNYYFNIQSTDPAGVRREIQAYLEDEGFR